jgi:hypothetical protein
MRAATTTTTTIALVLAVAACGASPAPSTTPHASAAPPPKPPPSTTEQPLIDDTALWEKYRAADYLVLTTHALADAIAPLAQYRAANGHVVATLEVESLLARARDVAPEATLKDAIARMHAHTAGKLAFVLLVGDAAHPSDRASPDSTPLPTFYLTKLGYEHHTPKEHDNPHAIPRDEESLYPSDDPYAVIASANGAAAKRIALGRIPARTPVDVQGFAQKVIAYESHAWRGDPSWRRRVTVYAGAANFGELADKVAEALANTMLDEGLTYDDDVRFTFAKYGSPYAYRFDRIEQKFVSDMNDGALIAAYVGHGAVTRFAPATFHDSSYEIGTAADASDLEIPAGKPLFFSLSCDTGAFDRPDGQESISEEMILNPNGPIAVFASSRESHPYPNALYGQGIIDLFINGRAASVGEGIVAMKAAMRQGSIPFADLLFGDDIDGLKREHESLYNLFGDPATRLAYPDAADVSLASAHVAPLANVAITVRAKGISKGVVVASLESRRSVVRGHIATEDDLDGMSPDAALAAMEANNKAANDKVIATQSQNVENGEAHFVFTAPSDSAKYVVKALVGDDTHVAVGHADLLVGDAAP